MKYIRPLIVAIFGLILILLLLSGWLIYRDTSAGQDAATPQPVLTAVAANPISEATAPAPSQPTPSLPPAVVQIFPTNTPVPTLPPTDTPVPTDTPLPTDTATPIPPTNTRIIIPPTNTPVPPSATPAPTGPQAAVTRGLIATRFALQDWRTSLVVNGQIWYEWEIANTSGSGVPYSTLGVMPRRNGVDMVRWYQNNWGGNNDVMPTNGLSWPSHLELPEPGEYTLRVVICFDGFQTCLDGNGTFHTLSAEIPITIR